MDVYFDFDEAILTKEAQVILKRSVQILKKNLKSKSVLQGIPLLPALTRTTKGCSERRSNAVNEYLTKEESSHRTGFPQEVLSVSELKAVRKEMLQMKRVKNPTHRAGLTLP